MTKRVIEKTLEEDKIGLPDKKEMIVRGKTTNTAVPLFRLRCLLLFVLLVASQSPLVPLTLIIFEAK